MPTLKKSVHRPWMPKHEPHAGRTNPNTKFYQSRAWRKLRVVKLAQQPICEDCFLRGIATPAQVVDHIVPINKGGAPLDLNNLQSLCYACHNRKSGQEAHPTR